MMTLQNASDAEKLAVELIMLLENNQIPSATVLAALEIIRCDYLHKQQQDIPFSV